MLVANMNIGRYTKALNGVVYLEILLVMLAAMDRIYCNVTSKTLAALDMVIEAGIVVFVVGVFLMAASWLILHILHETQTHGFSEDPVFEEIEGALRGWKNGIDGFSRGMLEINSFYEERGIADKMLQNGQYERLLRRKEFLDRRRSLYNEASAYYSTVLFGVLSIVVCQLLLQNTIQNGAVTALVVMGLIMGIGFFILWRIVESRKGGSFFYMMRNLENAKLVGRMNDYAMKPSYTMGKIDKLIFDARHILLDDLVFRNAASLSEKARKKSYAQIREVSALDLWAKDYRNIMMREIEIHGRKIYLLYDVNEGEKGGYQTREGLISEDYGKLYDILEENGMLHFGMTRAAARVERSENVKEMQEIT